MTGGRQPGGVVMCGAREPGTNRPVLIVQGSVGLLAWTATMSPERFNALNGIDEARVKQLMAEACADSRMSGP